MLKYFNEIRFENARIKYKQKWETIFCIFLQFEKFPHRLAELTEYKISTEKIKRCTHRPGYSRVCKSHHDCWHHHHDCHHVELKFMLLGDINTFIPRQIFD